MPTKKSSAKEPWDKPAPKNSHHTHLTAGSKAKAKASAKKAGRHYPSLVDNMNAAKEQRAAEEGGAATKAGSDKKKSATAKSSQAKGTEKASSKAKGSSKGDKSSPSKSAASKASGEKSISSQGKQKAGAGEAKKSESAPKAKKSTTGKAQKAGGAGKKEKAEVTKDPHGGLTAAGRRHFAETEGAHLQPGVKKKKISEMSLQELKRKGSWAVRFYGRDKLPPLIGKNGQPTRLALTAAAWGEPVPKTEAAARKIADQGHKFLERYHKLKEK